MILLLLFCLSFTFTITTQDLTVTSVNATNVLNKLEALQRISEDRNFIILSMKELETPRDLNDSTTLYIDESDYVESETDEEDSKYINEQDDTQPPILQNILRWLPKKKRSTVNKRIREEQAAIQDQELQVTAQNAARVAEILSVIKDSHLAASFMYREIKRIQRDRVIMDDIRQMILRVERSPKKGYKQSVIDCYKKAKAEADSVADSRLWGLQTNNLVINAVKDSLNDGVTG